MFCLTAVAVILSLYTFILRSRLDWTELRAFPCVVHSHWKSQPVFLACFSHIPQMLQVHSKPMLFRSLLRKKNTSSPTPIWPVSLSNYKSKCQAIILSCSKSKFPLETDLPAKAPEHVQGCRGGLRTICPKSEKPAKSPDVASAVFNLKFK